MSEDKTEWAFLFGPLSLLFMPAVAASATDLPYRNTVLRLSAALALVIGLAGFVVDPGIPIIMGPATVVLATAAGLIFQGRRR